MNCTEHRPVKWISSKKLFFLVFDRVVTMPCHVFTAIVLPLQTKHCKCNPYSWTSSGKIAVTCGLSRISRHWGLCTQTGECKIRCSSPQKPICFQVLAPIYIGAIWHVKSHAKSLQYEPGLKNFFESAQHSSCIWRIKLAMNGSVFFLISQKADWKHWIDSVIYAIKVDGGILSAVLLYSDSENSSAVRIHWSAMQAIGYSADPRIIFQQGGSKEVNH